MVSQIDPSVPIFGSPTTESVRANFQKAHDEITALQAAVDGKVNRPGDTMGGELLLSQDPLKLNEATTKRYVDNRILASVNALAYVGDYDAAADKVLTSNDVGFPANSALPAPAPANSQRFLTVKTGTPTSVGNQPPGGVLTGSWLISNGVAWVVYVSPAPGVTADNVSVLPITNLPGSTVQKALESVPSLYMPKAGGTFTGMVVLPSASPSLATHATTKAYVDARVASIGSPLYDAPADGTGYTRQDGAWANSPTFTGLQVKSATPVINLDTSFGTLAIALRSATKIRWNIQMDDTGTGGDLTFAPYDDTGSIYDMTYHALRIGRKSRVLYTNSSIFFQQAANAALQPTIAGNNLVPTAPSKDTLDLFAARSGAELVGGAIGLRGPTHTAPNAVEIYAGPNASRKYWTFNGSGGVVTADWSLGGSAGTGLNIKTNWPSGLNWGQTPISGNPNWNVIALQILHVSSSWAGFRMDVSSTYFDFQNAGTIARGGDGASVAWNVPSDERIKRDIKPSTVDALRIIRLIPVEEFKILKAVAQAAEIPDMAGQRKVIPGDVPVPLGLVAQHVARVLPNAVKTASLGGEGYEHLPSDLQIIDRLELIPYMLRAIQQLAAQMDDPPKGRRQ